MNKKLVIVCFLDKLTSQHFSSVEWPLHMTLVPPFTLAGQEGGLQDALRGLAQVASPFEVIATERDLFGPKNDLPVSLIGPSQELQSLHHQVTQVVAGTGAQPDSVGFGSPYYRFHVTDQRSRQLLPGSVVSVESFSLVDRQVNGQPGFKSVIHTFQLSKR